MRTRSLLSALGTASVLLWAGTGAAAQTPAPPKQLEARIPVYVTGAEPGPAPEFAQPGTDAKAITDSVKDLQEAFTAVKPKWIRTVPDRAAAVIVVAVARRTYDEAAEMMSVYTDVKLGDYTFPVTGAGDPWREAARSAIRQLDAWVGVNYPSLRQRTPAPDKP